MHIGLQQQLESDSIVCVTMPIIFVHGTDFGIQTLSEALAPVELIELDELLPVVQSIGRDLFWSLFADNQWLLCKATAGYDAFPSTTAHSVYTVALRGSGEVGTLQQNKGETLEALAQRMRATFKC